jgi:WhiB family transcriptional regulator, redox-sensing transcriptional regulator
VAFAFDEQDDDEYDRLVAWLAIEVEGLSTLSDRLAAWRPAWMAGGACRGVPTATFFRDRGAAADEARAICAGCAVRPECLAFATGHDEVGVWGGTASPAERRALRRAV